MKKLKIGYYCADINPDKTKSLGIYKVSKEILREMINNKSLNINLILSEENKKFYREFKCNKVISKTYKFDFLNKFFYYPSFANKLAKTKDLDILFFPKGHIPFSKVKNVKYFSIIHDLIPFYYLKRRDLKMLPVSFLLWSSAKRSDFIFTISKFSKQNLKKISNKPLEIIPLGYNPSDKAIKPKINKNYVFISGNKNKHKNLDLSINLLKEYNKKFKKNYLPIISSGKFSEEELAGLYKYAKFSIFLSDIEGFGLPLIESYHWKTPVVFNNKTSLAEIGKGLPGACNVNDKKSVFRAIEEIERLDKKRIKIISKELKEKYNWHSCGSAISKKIQFFMTSNSK